MTLWLILSMVMLAAMAQIATLRRALTVLGSASAIWVLLAGMAGSEMLWMQLRGIGWPAVFVLAAGGTGLWLQYRGVGYSHQSLAHAMVMPGGESRPRAMRLMALCLGLVEAVFVSLVALQVYILLQAELSAASLVATGIVVVSALVFASKVASSKVQIVLASVGLVLAAGWVVLWVPAVSLLDLGRPAAPMSISPGQVLGFSLPFVVFWAGSPALFRMRHIAGKQFHQRLPLAAFVLLCSSAWVGLQVYTLDLAQDLPLLPQITAQVFHGSLRGLATGLVLWMLLLQLLIFWLSQTQLYAIVLAGPAAGWQWQVAAAPIAVMISAGIPLMLGGMPGWLTLAAGAWLACVFWPWLLLRPANSIRWFVAGVGSGALVYTAAILQQSPGDPAAWAAGWVCIVWCCRRIGNYFTFVKDRNS